MCERERERQIIWAWTHDIVNNVNGVNDHVSCISISNLRRINSNHYANRCSVGYGSGIHLMLLLIRRLLPSLFDIIGAVHLILNFIKYLKLYLRFTFHLLLLLRRLVRCVCSEWCKSLWRWWVTVKFVTRYVMRQLRNWPVWMTSDAESTEKSKIKQ